MENLDSFKENIYPTVVVNVAAILFRKLLGYNQSPNVWEYSTVVLAGLAGLQSTPLQKMRAKHRASLER